ncbi:P-type conjugative transfer protein TrbL [Sedimenticola sp.]|uniref:P-type conjugative transfer protein TrbL n=1 Tax=Sedimenticola sp. TaxID=1940285 RepID=UPI003D102F8A
MRKGTVQIFMALILMVFGDSAFALINENNLLDGIVTQYHTAASSWSATILNAALWLFWTLALLETTWTGITLALRQADFVEVVSEIVLRIITIGFFLALLLRGPTWAGNIIESLGQLAGQASIAGGGVGSVTPSDVFDAGLKLADKMTSTISFWDNAIDSMGLLIAALITIIVFALITAFLVMTMVEIWIVVFAGMILLGFGGSRFTKDFALKYLIYALSVGLKFFVMLLVIGIGQSFISQWEANWENQDSQVLLAIGVSIVLLALVREIPNIMQGLISGMSFATGDSLVRSGGQVMGAGASVGAAIAATGVALGGGAAAIRAATNLAQAQGATGVGRTTLAAAQNLGSAFKREANAGIQRGQYAGPKPGMGFRMAEALKTAEKELQGNSIEKGR